MRSSPCFSKILKPVGSKKMSVRIFLKRMRKILKRMRKILKHLGKILKHLRKILKHLEKILKRMRKILMRLGRLPKRMGKLLMRLGRLLMRLGRLLKGLGRRQICLRIFPNPKIAPPNPISIKHLRENQTFSLINRRQTRIFVPLRCSGVMFFRNCFKTLTSRTVASGLSIINYQLSIIFLGVLEHILNERMTKKAETRLLMAETRLLRSVSTRSTINTLLDSRVSAFDF